jgi:hypothetical protein
MTLSENQTSTMQVHRPTPTKADFEPSEIENLGRALDAAMKLLEETGGSPAEVPPHAIRSLAALAILNEARKGEADAARLAKAGVNAVRGKRPRR